MKILARSLYKWNSTTVHGFYVLESIRTNIYDLDQLLIHLYCNNNVLLGINEEGIIVGYDSDYKDLEDKIIHLESLFYKLEEEILNKYKAKESKEVNGFHILWNMIPEELKQQLKIYIRK